MATKHELQAEIQRLRADKERVANYIHPAVVEQLQAQLAAANVLLKDAAGWFESPQHTIAPGAKMCCTRIRAHLAGQPAAPSRTVAEQWVLDAMARLPLRRRGDEYDSNNVELARAFDAELARRGERA